jgi:hypothetical protein
MLATGAIRAGKNHEIAVTGSKPVRKFKTDNAKAAGPGAGCNLLIIFE